MSVFRTQIASAPDRQNPVFEIWLGDTLVSEVSNEEPGKAVIEIYPPSDAACWRFHLDDFRAVLDQASKNLDYGL